MQGFAGAIALLSSIGFTTLAGAQTVTGVWEDEEKKGHIEIYSCAEQRQISDPALLNWMCNKAPAGSARLCGRVTEVTEAGKAELKKKNKPLADVLNKPVLCIGPPNATGGRWTGGLYSVYLDTRADAYVQPRSAKELHVKGCKLIETALTCGEDVWTRVR